MEEKKQEYTVVLDAGDGKSFSANFDSEKKAVDAIRVYRNGDEVPICIRRLRIKGKKNRKATQKVDEVIKVLNGPS